MAILFWMSCALIVYVYIGYPVCLEIWARMRPRPIPTGSADSDMPGISIIVAARNEGARLKTRIDNLLQLDYPASRRQIIVVSDGSDDDTPAVLARYGDAIDIVAIPAGGKALALNAGVARARFDVLVFADARQVFAHDALIELVKPLADPEIGVVSGELFLDSPSAEHRLAMRDRRAGRAGQLSPPTERRIHPERRTVRSTIADGVDLYWRYEKHLRRLESMVASSLGATGAIYAMRRALWSPLPADTILDDVLAPMRCVIAGYRSVFNGRARAFDWTARDAATEARRKARTLAGNYQILRLEPRLLLPWRNPVWVQYVSHKVGRLVVPYALCAAWLSSALLAEHSLIYATAFASQCAFYLLAGYGAWLARNARQPAETPVRRGTRTWSADRAKGERWITGT